MQLISNASSRTCVLIRKPPANENALRISSFQRACLLDLSVQLWDHWNVLSWVPQLLLELSLLVKLYGFTHPRVTALIWAYIPSFVPNSHSTQQAQSGIQKNQPQTNYEELKKSMTCCCWKTMSQARPSVKKCKLAKGIQSIWWVFFFLSVWNCDYLSIYAYIYPPTPRKGSSAILNPVNS